MKCLNSFNADVQFLKILLAEYFYLYLCSSGFIRVQKIFFGCGCAAPCSLRSNKRGKHGFTLFEVLITLSILAVVLSLLYLTFHQSMAAMADTDDRAEVIQKGRMVLERVAGDLKGALLIPRIEVTPAFLSGLVGRSTKEGNEFLDRLDFTASTPPFSSSAESRWGLRELGYYPDRQPGAKRFTLFRRQDEAMDGKLSQGGRSLAICDGVLGLSFSYFDRQGKKGKEWNSLEGERRNQLPFRVEIHLRLEDSRGRAHDFRTQVYLPSAG